MEFFLSLIRDKKTKKARREAAGEKFGGFFVWEGFFATPRREAAGLSFFDTRMSKNTQIALREAAGEKLSEFF